MTCFGVLLVIFWTTWRIACSHFCSAVANTADCPLNSLCCHFPLYPCWQSFDFVWIFTRHKAMCSGNESCWAGMGAWMVTGLGNLGRPIPLAYVWWPNPSQWDLRVSHLGSFGNRLSSSRDRLMKETPPLTGHYCIAWDICNCGRYLATWGHPQRAQDCRDIFHGWAGAALPADFIERELTSACIVMVHHHTS